MAKKSKRTNRLVVKKKFVTAIKKLRKMRPKDQRLRVSMSSKEFINDLTSFLRKIRNRSDLVPKKHKRTLSNLKKSLLTLVNSKTSLTKKRSILSGQNLRKKEKKHRGGQRGGILPILIPIITAAIAAGGGIAASATGAAMMRA